MKRFKKKIFDNELNITADLDVIPHSTDVNLRLAVEDVSLSSTWILGLNVVIIHLKGGVGAGASQSHDVMFSIVDFDGYFTQTVIICAHVVRCVQMTFHLSFNQCCYPTL